MYKRIEEYDQALKVENDKYQNEYNRLLCTKKYKLLCQLKKNHNEWLTKHIKAKNQYVHHYKNMYWRNPTQKNPTDPTDPTDPSNLIPNSVWTRKPLDAKYIHVNDDDHLYNRVFYKIALLFTAILLENLQKTKTYQTLLNARINAVESTITNSNVQCKRWFVIIDRFYKGTFEKCMFCSPEKTEKTIYFPLTEDATHNKPFGINTFNEIMQKLFLNQTIQNIKRGKNDTNFYVLLYRSLIRNVSLKEAVEYAVINAKPKKAVKYAVINTEPSCTSHLKFGFNCYHFFVLEVVNEKNIIILTKKAMDLYKKFVENVLYEMNLGHDIIEMVLYIVR